MAYAKSTQLYLRLLQYLRPYLLVFFISLLGMVLAAGSEVALPVLIKPFLDGTFIQKDRSLLVWTPVALILIVVCRGGGGFLAQFGSAWVGNKIVMDLRLQMHQKILELPLSYFSSNKSGSVISRFTFDVYQVENSVTQVVTVLVKDFLTLAGLLGYLLYLDWKLTAITLIMVPPIAIIVRYFNARLRASSRAIQTAMGELTANVQETVEGIKVIRIYDGYKTEAERFQVTANNLRGVIMKQISAAAANVPLVQFFAVLATGVVIYYVILEAQADKATVGSFVSFLAAMLMMTAPIKRLAGVTQHIQRGLAAAESIFGLLDEVPEKQTGSVSISDVSGRIEFDNVVFSYGDANSNAIDGLSLDINPGETIALVGASGSGKTTLANLVPRFFEPTNGCIRLDGYDIRTLTLKSLRKNIALVSQETMLFNDSILGNIAYGSNSTSEEEKIQRAANAANVTEFSQRLPAGLGSSVGEKGSNLSGGQRQRVAIARAVLKEAKVVILDEATSALDSESERFVQEAIDNLTHEKTTIIIAHRLSTIENVDRIVVLERGKIAEMGTHSELLAKGGIYSKMVALQKGGEFSSN